MQLQVGKYTLGDIAEVFEKLSDDVSREIFMWRLRYILDGGSLEIFKKSVKEFMYKSKMNVPVMNGKDIIIYGFSNLTRRLDAEFFHQIEEHHKCHILAIVDKFGDNTDAGQMYEGIPLISPSIFYKKYNDRLVLISSSIDYLKTEADLLAHGIQSTQIVPFAPVELFLGKQYFQEQIIGKCEDEVYLDCGVLDGLDIVEFVRFSENKYRKIVGFEPDFKNFEVSKANLEQRNIANVQLINKGVWSQTGQLAFHVSGNGSSGNSEFISEVSKFSNFNIPHGEVVNVPVIAIDDICSTEKVTLIKMDVEGSELDALRGAENIIKRDKPRLAICIYHKPEDIIEIPRYLASLVPDYKFYIRHHMDNTWETVLYAVK